MRLRTGGEIERLNIAIEEKKKTSNKSENVIYMQKSNYENEIRKLRIEKDKLHGNELDDKLSEDLEKQSNLQY